MNHFLSLFTCIFIVAYIVKEEVGKLGLTMIPLSILHNSRLSISKDISYLPTGLYLPSSSRRTRAYNLCSRQVRARPRLAPSESTCSNSPIVNRIAASSNRYIMSSANEYKKVLTIDTINPQVKKVEYAVRGELSNRAGKYADMLSQGKGEANHLPFESVVTANIGNPQQQPHLAQKPLTFWRQVSTTAYIRSG